MAHKGRKPKGQFSGKLANFSTRIQVETRKALEREAKASGQSISQLAERLLLDGLAARRDRTQDRALRALCYLIGQTANQVVGLNRNKIDPLSWRSDPFFFEAFRIALSIVLAALKPKGEIKAPNLFTEVGLQAARRLAPTDEDWVADPAGAWKATWVNSFLESYKSPEARGRFAAEYILNSLADMSQMSVEERQRRIKLLEEAGTPAMADQYYGMPEAAKDLDVSLPQEILAVERAFIRWNTKPTDKAND